MEALPLRVVIFQILFLLIAIAIETIILYRYLSLEYKTAVQYAASINLFSTFLGWVVFFNLLPFLPPDLKTQLISFIFFEQFYENNWLDAVSPILIAVSFFIFLGTFGVEVASLNLLEIVLEKRPKKEPTSEEFSALSRTDRGIQNKIDERTYAIFVANAWSFSAILLLLFVRYFEQSYLSG